MPTRISVAQHYSSTPEQVFAMLTSENYARTRAEHTGALSVEVLRTEVDDAVTLEVVRQLPAEVPGFARSFVGDSIGVTEVQVWPTPFGPPATFTATFTAPMSVTGTITVTPTADGCRVDTEGEVRASVPLVGGKLEGLAREQFERYLNAELAIAEEWLSG
jgi:hypothetical protein